MTRRLKRILCTMLMSLLATSASALSSQEVQAAFGGRVLDPVEGVWQFADDGAILMITRASATTFAITILDSPRPDVAAGTVIGKAVVTAKHGVYDAELDAKALHHKRVKKSMATLTVTDDGMLAIQPYTTGYKLSWWRWIPYIYRVGVINNDTRPKNLDAARKIYPFDNISDPPCL